MRQEEFGSLYDEYKNVVYSAIHFYVRDHDIKEDLHQEVWLNVFKSLPSFDSRAKLSTWIFGLAKNVILAWRRKNPPPVEAPEEVAAPSEEERTVARLDLERAMIDLSPEEQQILFMRYTMDLSYEELAAKTGLPVSTVKSRLFEARAKLRRRLEKKPRLKTGKGAGEPA